MDRLSVEGLTRLKKNTRYRTRLLQHLSTDSRVGMTYLHIPPLGALQATRPRICFLLQGMKAVVGREFYNGSVEWCHDVIKSIVR